MPTTKTPKSFVVILDPSGSSFPGNLYLGELDPGVRQGVRQLENAVRFTLNGAKRVAFGYHRAQVAHVDECV